MTLRSNYVMLLNELNLTSVLPVMFAENLVSPTEYRVLQEMNGRSSERDRIDKLLMALPRKGKEFYELFCRCIVWSGQIELATNMGFDVSSVEDLNKYGANMPKFPSGSNITRPSGPPRQSSSSPVVTPSHSYSPAGPDPSNFRPSSVGFGPYNTLSPDPINFRSPMGVGPYNTPSPDPGNFRPPYMGTYNTPFPNPGMNFRPPNMGVGPYNTPSPVTPTQPQVLHPTTDNVLVLYCNDEYLLTAPELSPIDRRSQTDYCQEVSDFVETLTHLSNKYDPSGRMYQAYRFTYDRLATEGNFIANFLSWSDTAINSCDTILLLCSPQLAAQLSTDQDGGVVNMEKGPFNKHSLVNAFARKTVIPVFLNMERHDHWLPQPLMYGTSYSVNIKALQEGCVGVQSEQEWAERVQTLLRDDTRLSDLCELWKYLLKERKQVGSPDSTVPPLIPPESISWEKLMDLATDVSFKWQELGTRLGVSFSAQQKIQFNQTDSVTKTRTMFAEWVREKGQKANKQALIEGLRGSKLNALADRVEQTF